MAKCPNTFIYFRFQVPPPLGEAATGPNRVAALQDIESIGPRASHFLKLISVLESLQQLLSSGGFSSVAGAWHVFLGVYNWRMHLVSFGCIWIWLLYIGIKKWHHFFKININIDKYSDTVILFTLDVISGPFWPTNVTWKVLVAQQTHVNLIGMSWGSCTNVAFQEAMSPVTEEHHII